MCMMVSCRFCLPFRLTTYGLAELQIEGDGNCQVSLLLSSFINPEFYMHNKKLIFFARMNWPSTFAINLCFCFLWLNSIFLDLSSAI